MVKEQKLKYVILLTLIISLTSCSDFQEEEVYPASQNNEVTAFFAKHLPTPTGSEKSELFFVGDEKNDIFITINSTDELKRNMSASSIELPDIDFNAYTLIIGQHQMGYSSFVAGQCMTVESKKMKLLIITEHPENAYAAMGTMYYWGLYPKLPKKSIHIQIVNIFEKERKS